MMTLDGAIKHAEEVAEEQDKLCKRYDDASGYSRSHNESIRVADAKRCERYANEYRQLAEWLKELKEARIVLDQIIAEIQGLRNCSCSCSDGIIDDVEDIIDKYRESEE
jgi:hypothetical protein